MTFDKLLEKEHANAFAEIDFMDNEHELDALLIRRLNGEIEPHLSKLYDQKSQARGQLQSRLMYLKARMETISKALE